jgi:predicted RNA binding protein YcfA (HicA-like mRNA interferase family)
MASIVALRMIKALVHLGWSVDRASGTSHHVLTKPGYRPLTVPVKKGRALKEGTARAILRRAGGFVRRVLRRLLQHPNVWQLPLIAELVHGRGADAEASCDLANRHQWRVRSPLW